MADHQVTVTASGSAGAATGAGYTPAPVHGMVRAIRWEHDGPATTDITITETDGAGNAVGLEQTLLTVTNAAASGTAYPHVQAQDTSNSALTGIYVQPCVLGRFIKVAAAQANSGTIVTVTIQMIDLDDR